MRGERFPFQNFHLLCKSFLNACQRLFTPDAVGPILRGARFAFPALRAWNAHVKNPFYLLSVVCFPHLFARAPFMYAFLSNRAYPSSKCWPNFTFHSSDKIGNSVGVTRRSDRIITEGPIFQ